MVVTIVIFLAIFMVRDTFVNKSVTSSKASLRFTISMKEMISNKDFIFLLVSSSLSQGVLYS